MDLTADTTPWVAAAGVLDPVAGIGVFLTALAVALVRPMALMFMVPFMGERMLGGLLRGGVAFALALVTLPRVWADLHGGGLDMGQMLVLLPKEVLIGVMFGFVASVPFWVAASAGELLDTLRGASMAEAISPMYDDNASTTGDLLVQTVTVVVFITGGFNFLLQGMYLSYTAWPVTTWYPAFVPALAERAIDHFDDIMLWTLILAAPMLIVCLAIDTMMGLLNRFVPEINVFVLSFPFKALAVSGVLAVYGITLVDFFVAQQVPGQTWMDRVGALLHE